LGLKTSAQYPPDGSGTNKALGRVIHQKADGDWSLAEVLINHWWNSSGDIHNDSAQAQMRQLAHFATNLTAGKCMK
jgi:hypothetical protein